MLARRTPLTRPLATLSRRERELRTITSKKVHVDVKKVLTAAKAA
jgi:hypothetical protein